MRNTIKHHKDFAMGENSPSVKTALFIVKMDKSKLPNDARYGLIVTKKTFKLAVHRNRAKRLLRNWIAKNENLLNPNYDYIFIARRNILESDLDTGVLTVKSSLETLNKQI